MYALRECRAVQIRTKQHEPTGDGTTKVYIFLFLSEVDVRGGVVPVVVVDMASIVVSSSFWSLRTAAPSALIPAVAPTTFPL